MKIIEVKQGTPEWFAARVGKVTASVMDRIITPKTGKASAQQHGLICEMLADEAMGGAPEGVEFMSRAMEHGIAVEPEARKWYAFDADADVDQVGLCVSDCGRFGCSPDGLVGEVGGLELKCPLAKTHIGYILAGVLPDEYKAQVHGSLIVTGRDWWDFVSYCYGLPPFKIRVTRDEFTVQLEAALNEFWPRYAAAREQLAAMGAFDHKGITEEQAQDAIF